MNPRLPDFIIAGAPRCGTTWLYALADRHPAIRMAKPVVPEPKFFLRPDLFERGLEYHSRTWFADIPADLVAGEKSANYLESAVAARRIHDALPRVRLVFVLRNPIHRAFSNYLWSRQNGLEPASFAEALAQEGLRERNVAEHLRYARPHALFSRGLYAELLMPYLSLFPREHVLVLRYEDVVAAPAEIAERLHRFLGVAPRPADGEAQPAVNAARDGASETMEPAIYNVLAARYAEPNRCLAELLGPGFRSGNREVGGQVMSRDDKDRPRRVTIVTPVYNEEASLMRIGPRFRACCSRVRICISKCCSWTMAAWIGRG